MAKCADDCFSLCLQRPDGLLKLYDMSEDPERRAFLDKLIVYNDERGTPITQCPTISKQPLDLFRLYLIVKDRGGFVEVSVVSCLFSLWAANSSAEWAVLSSSF